MSHKLRKVAEVIKVMIALEIAKNYQKWKQDIEKLQKRKPEKQGPRPVATK